MDSPLPQDYADARERDVQFFIRIVDDFGSATERFFGRIYEGLRRRQAADQMAELSDQWARSGAYREPDPMAALKQANRELTSRVKEAQLLAARLQSVFARIDEGVVMQDTEGRIVLMNEAAHQLLGSTKAFWESDLGRLFEKSRQKPTGNELEPLGPPIRVQVNDRILGATVASAATPDGQALGTVIVLRDVTKEALSDRLRDEFVTQISHELRTPLTAIKGMSEVLLSQPEDRPPNRKFLEAIGRNAAVLDRMIVELLDISEISAGSFAVRTQTLALDELVLDVVKGQEARIKKANLNVGLMVVNHERTQIVGDDRRLRWAIGHLLDNSINYTLKGGLITFRIGKIKGDRVLLEIIDTGVGISEKDLPHVFERFYRGEAKTPAGKTIDPRGLGQGLFVARAVAEAHGGYLAVSSNIGQGSKFTLALPYVKDAA